jgi:hypothetical protein
MLTLTAASAGRGATVMTAAIERSATAIFVFMANLHHSF